MTIEDLYRKKARNHALMTCVGILEAGCAGALAIHMSGFWSGIMCVLAIHSAVSACDDYTEWKRIRGLLRRDECETISKF